MVSLKSCSYGNISKYRQRILSFRHGGNLGQNFDQCIKTKSNSYYKIGSQKVIHTVSAAHSRTPPLETCF